MANQKMVSVTMMISGKWLLILYRLGQSVKELSSEYGVSEVTVYTWIKKYSPVELEDGSSVTPNDYAKRNA